MRIRSRLLLLVLAVLIPASIGSAIGSAYLYSEEQQFNRTSLRETARALAMVLDREMTWRQTVLRTLAASASLQANDLRRFDTHATAVAAERGVAIIVSDPNGRQLLNTRLPFGSALPNVPPAEQSLRDQMGPDATLIGNLHVPADGRDAPSFAVQIPVKRDDGIVQYLTMVSAAAQLQSVLGEQRLPDGWHATIVDRDGVVVARSKEPQRHVGVAVPRDLWKQIAAKGEGFHAGMSLDQSPSTFFFSRAPHSQWTFVVAVPDSVLFGPPMRAAALMAGLALLLLGLSLAAAWLVARRIVRPVEALRAAAERLGRYERVDHAPSGTLEIDAVNEALAKASTQLRRNNAELEHRVAQAMATYERTQRDLVQSQKLQALGRLTGGIAHDFNNVLQTLTTGLQAALLAPREQLPELVGRCQRAVSRGGELARQLMAFGQVQHVRVRTIDTTAALAEATPLLDGALPTNVDLDFDLEPGLWPVTVDPAQLELALLNLVINARDAMPAGGSMVLRGSNCTLTSPRGELRPGEYVALSLADTGEGMSPEVVAHAMDPFFTTKGMANSTGMGLPQAYGFARQSGGTVELESQPGVGTTVVLYLPRAAAAPKPPDEVPRAPAPCEGKVLIVEDDELVRETVISALRTAGFEVHSAATGDEALERIEGGETFDAVLTDVVMPGALNGIELAQLIRERHPKTGVVIATGYTDRRFHVPGVRALPKPYDLEDAVSALNEAVAGG